MYFFDRNNIIQPVSIKSSILLSHWTLGGGVEFFSIFLVYWRTCPANQQGWCKGCMGVTHQPLPNRKILALSRVNEVVGKFFACHRKWDISFFQSFCRYLPNVWQSRKIQEPSWKNYYTNELFFSHAVCFLYEKLRFNHIKETQYEKVNYPDSLLLQHAISFFIICKKNCVPIAVLELGFCQLLWCAHLPAARVCQASQSLTKTNFPSLYITVYYFSSEFFVRLHLWTCSSCLSC